MNTNRLVPIYSPGDTLPDRSDGIVRRYGMDGDRYLTAGEIGDRADVLWDKAQACGKTDWFVQIVCRLRLAETSSNGSALEAVMILAAAGITWYDICYMKS
jgi:hypothetical protein